MIGTSKSKMLSLATVALLLVAHVQADNSRGSPQIWRRDGPLVNSTADTNASTISTTSSTRISTSTPTTTTSFSTTSSNDTSSTEISPTRSPTYPSNTTTTTPEETCDGSVTYTGSVYPTVFITVTEGFDVTVTDSSASITESETLITPLPACTATVVPQISNGPFEATLGTPIATIAVSTFSVQIDYTVPTTATETGTSTEPGLGDPHPSPNVASSDGEPQPPAATPQETGHSESISILMSTIYATAPYTSTVVVTKKTPVPVVAPPTSAPPVFQNSPPPTTSPESPGTTHQNNPGNGGNSVSQTSKNPAPPPSPAVFSAAAAPPPSPANNPAPTPLIVTHPGTSTGLANIIASIVNSAFAPAQPDQVAPATTIFNVPVAVGASSILVGTQVVAIPTSGAATVRAGDQTFTVKASEIVASGTTIAYGTLEAAQIASSIPPTRVTAAPGVVLTVQGTTAVIAGITYRIGEGATPTTITVSGQRIQLGPSGVVLASTTIPAGAITPTPMVVESVGSLAFSVDASEVVVKGTTYRIGSGAPTIRTTVDGQSLSIGPGGVGVGTKTTLKPMSVVADQTGAGAGSGTSVATGTTTADATAAVSTGAASHTDRIPFLGVFGWLLMAVGGLLLL